MQKNVKNYNVDLMMPDELNELKKLVREFLNRYENIENEIEGLKQSKKDLMEEYANKLDMKTLSAALRVLKIKSSVAHKDTFDMFVEVLTDDHVNNLT